MSASNGPAGSVRWEVIGLLAFDEGRVCKPESNTHKSYEDIGLFGLAKRGGRYRIGHG